MRRLALLAGGIAIAALILGRQWLPDLEASRVAAVPKPPATPALPTGSTALGRLEPKDGIIRVAGPSNFAVVIGQLMVDVNDRVTAGQTIAILDDHDAVKADVARLDAELHNAQSEWQRYDRLFKEGIVST